MDWEDLEPGDVLVAALGATVFLVLAKSEGSLTTVNLLAGPSSVHTERLPVSTRTPALLEAYRVLRGGRGA